MASRVFGGDTNPAMVSLRLKRGIAATLPTRDPNIDQSILRNFLKQGQVPIHEPGLDTLVASSAASTQAGGLRFIILHTEAVSTSSTYFIAVGKPANDDD